MKIFNPADLHYCAKHLTWVDRAFGFAVDHAIEAGADVAVISGDLSDAAMGTHEEAFARMLGKVRQLANCMPLIILQGTFSHDRVGSLSAFKLMGTLHPIWVGERVEQIALKEDERGKYFAPIDIITRASTLALFSLLPSLNKADPKVLEVGAHDYMCGIMDDFAPANRLANDLGIPTILVSHGTVNGAQTESKHALVSPDHEFSPEILYSSGAQAIMLGHIHRYQWWCHEAPLIAYPGSITTLVHGVHDPSGFLMWEFNHGIPSAQFVETPSRRLIELEYDGPPDMEDLAREAETVDGECYVRLRYTVDQEYAHTVDKAAIKALFAAAASFKDEGTINVIESVRAHGIGRKESIDAKLAYYLETTGDTSREKELIDALHLLRSNDVEQVVEMQSARLAEIVRPEEMS